jgi:hypothetical protein
VRALLLIAIAGCYNPTSYRPCHTICVADDGCTPGFVCGSNGYCREPNAGNCSPTLDAPTGVDAISIDAPPGSICFGTGFIKNFCFLPSEIPTAPLTLPSPFDTGGAGCSKVLPQVGLSPPEICVMVGQSFTLPGTLRVVGKRPLAIITTMGITISGTLNASSDGLRGPGSPGAGVTCGVAAIGESAVSQTQGGGGGGGGALRTGGGGGGAGTGGLAGGMGAVTREVLFVRGGCDGARGGAPQGGLGGMQGFGGGAVYLLTNDTLSISGVINASGSGGGAPGPRGGGGGGGSGGFIGLDAKTFDISDTARIFASGGSGASGGGETDDGVLGGSADPANDPGPTGSASGGGTGGSGWSTAPGDKGEEPSITLGAGGGGGGGGGAGFIGHAGGTFPNLSTQIVRPKANTM